MKLWDLVEELFVTIEKSLTWEERLTQARLDEEEGNELSAGMTLAMVRREVQESKALLERSRTFRRTNSELRRFSGGKEMRRCPKCGQPLAKGDWFRQHPHGGQSCYECLPKPYSCQECGEAFTNHQGLSGHRRTTGHFP